MEGVAWAPVVFLRFIRLNNGGLQRNFQYPSFKSFYTFRENIVTLTPNDLWPVTVTVSQDHAWLEWWLDVCQRPLPSHFQFFMLKGMWTSEVMLWWSDVTLADDHDSRSPGGEVRSLKFDDFDRGFSMFRSLTWPQRSSAWCRILKSGEADNLMVFG